VKIPQQTVNLKLKKEMSKLRISGPFYTPPFQNFVCSPLGLVPNKEHGQFRLNHDLSFPKGNSVNSCIPSEFTTVNYQNIETVVELVQFYGPKWQNVTFRMPFCCCLCIKMITICWVFIGKVNLIFSCFTHGCFFFLSNVRIIFFINTVDFKL
jgi:hypothetical protein